MQTYLRVVGVLLGSVLAAAGCLSETDPPTPGTINPPRPPPRRPDAAVGPASSPDAPGTYQPPPDAPAGPSACETPPATRKNAGEPCACDSECSTGYCQEGACCNGILCGKRAPGAPCQRPDQCESGFCADGVCCNVACGGSCVSCNQPDRTGECMPVPAGHKDPRDGCRQEPQESCGGSGFCNGQGGCAKYPPGAACGVSSCSGPRTFVPGGECDGDGACIKGEPLDCTPFTCEASTCRASCLMDADCVPPNICSQGRCGLRGKGQACTAGDQCQTGFCVDGVCCENACAGRCQFCAQPNARGTCTPVRAGAPDPRAAAGVTDPAKACLDQGAPSCGTNGRCDGKMGCQKYENGTTCRPGRCDTGPNAETGPSVCMGGSCHAPDAVTCAPFKGCTGTRCITQCGSDNQCSTGFLCVDGKCGKRPNGGVCTSNTNCLSGICAQGRCCNQACNSPCHACNVPGSLGTCAPVKAGTEDASCGDPRCSGCDEMGSCARTPGASCAAPMCGTGANRNAVVTQTCTDGGTCLRATTPCPESDVCKAGMCACPQGSTRCGMACVDLNTDANNCGACGTTCPPETPQCTDGHCVAMPPMETCPIPGFIRCGADCINPQIDLHHCGGCEPDCTAMMPPQVCLGGTCRPAAL